jgi:hypothetical protein
VALLDFGKLSKEVWRIYQHCSNVFSWTITISFTTDGT